MTIREVAEDFVNRMNPSGLDGTGSKPNDFDTRIVTYDVDGYPDYVLDLSFNYDPDYLWFVVCEIRDRETEELCEFMSGDSIPNVEELARQIKMAFEDI